MSIYQERKKAFLGLTEKNGTEKPFDPKWFDITKEQQEVIQTNASGMSLLYGLVRGAEYYKISNDVTAKEMWDNL